MASTSVISATQGPQPSFIPGGGTFQPRHQYVPRSHMDGHSTFFRPRHHRFQPRFPPNSNTADDGSISYDGKRMRKAIHRKAVDYNPSVFKYLQNRVWQRDRRDEHQIQPDALYSSDLLPPSAFIEKPMNCVTTKFVRTSTNKFRCPVFCLSWTPEGRRLVTGASSGEFTLWNGLTFHFETILQAHETAVRAMQWSHSDAWMITADHAGYIKYWQSNMNNVKMFQAHKEPIRGIRWAWWKGLRHDGKILLSLIRQWYFIIITFTVCSGVFLLVFTLVFFLLFKLFFFHSTSVFVWLCIFMIELYFGLNLIKVALNDDEV